ncbi:hypothetical protein [Micromonospora sp. NPDC023888]|uniref:hypothetical protein n=1 Tax=Micromonospora sp. NPDC023888 TaxID=3155607 RepID=UPI0033DA54AA
MAAGRPPDRLIRQQSLIGQPVMSDEDRNDEVGAPDSVPSVSRETYLCVSPYRDVYPSRHHADFEAEEHVLACADDATPLLWLAMFRPDDLRNTGAGGSRAGDAGLSPTPAPVVSRQRALTNLYSSIPLLDRLLRGSVSEHAELLREAMRWLPGPVVTVEWWADDEPYDATPADLDKALTVFDLGPDAGNSGIDALTRATGLRLHEPLVPARLLLDRRPATTAQQVDLHRVLGRSHLRMVPWETPF